MVPTIGLSVNASKYLETLNVGMEIDGKVVSESGLFVFVEMKALDNVVPDSVKNLKPH